ncbi:MAG: ABC transporter substrate-binding protein [Eubacteriaceae bacterium]|nr:ABC transporter substrate-binding protein [Eubacteriaceae bacterium]
MKKLTVLLLTALLIAGMFAGCGAKKEEAPEAIRIGGLKGPTSMGMVKLLDDAAAGKSENTYDFVMASAAPELTPKLIKGELDILAVPANLGPTLYNNTDGEVQILAVNTLGVIYIVEAGGETVKSIQDLKGQTIYATGKGQTPEYCLKYILKENGIDPDKDLTIEWKSEATESVATLQAEGKGIAMLPQPFVTVAQNTVEGLRIALSLTEEWDKLNNGSTMITGALVVRKEFAEKYPQTLASFLEEYAASTKWINENVEEGAALVEKFDIVKAPIAKKAIPYCNITCITGNDMVEPLNGYLGVLLNENPQAVGGSLPGDDLYCILK